MTHDLDDAIRASLRRNAESAPTVVDLDGVRDRATAIGRRRVLDASLAVAATVIVALGIGVLVHGMSSNQTLPPPVNSPTATSGPGALPWIAYTNFDANAQPSGATRIQLRINGTDRTLRSVPGSSSVTVLGWFGADHQTLVWGEGQPPYAEQVLYTATVSTNGTTLGPVAPLQLPGQAMKPGRAFVGTDGALRFWMPDTLGSAVASARVITINDSLDGASSPWQVGPGAAAFVTAASVGVVSGDGRLTVHQDPTVGHGDVVPVCGSLQAVGVSPDSSAVALGCTNGRAELVDLATLKGTRIPDVPESKEPDVLLGLWWDPQGHLHATTGTDLTQTGYHVHTWTLSGGAWVQQPGEGLLTRWFTPGSPTLRLERKTTDGASTDNSGRLIVETDPPIDLGPAGSSVAVRPFPPSAPAPTDAATSALGWTATVRASAVGRSTSVYARVNGNDVLVSGGPSSSDPSAVDATSREVVGWYGADGRTLVWQAQPLSSSQAQPLSSPQPRAATLNAVTFAADGSIAEPAHQLTLSGPGGEFTGAQTGYAFPLPDQSFAVVTFVRASTAQEVLYVDRDFRVTSHRAVSAGTPAFVTPTYVGMQDPGRSPLVVSSRSGSGTADSLGTCVGGYTASTSDDEQLVHLSCDGRGYDQIDPELVVAHETGLEAWRPYSGPNDDPIVSTWFSPDGRTHVATVTPTGSVATWVLTDDLSQSWGPDERQGVRFQVFTTSGATVDFISAVSDIPHDVRGRWSANTDPTTDLGPAVLDAGMPGGTPLAVRPQS